MWNKGIKIMACFILTWAISACSLNGENSNSGKIPINKGKFGVIYTNAVEPKSKLLIVDESGDIISNVNIKAARIRKIEEAKNGGWVLPASYDDVIHYINEKGEISNRKAPGPTNFVKKDSAFEIAAYNTEAFQNTLIVKEEKKQWKVKQKGYMGEGVYDDQYIYIYADIPYEDKSVPPDQHHVVYMIKRDTGKLIKKIPLKEKSARDMKWFKKKLLLTTENRLTLIDPKKSKADYLPTPTVVGEPMTIVKEDNKFYVTFFGGSVVEYDDHFNIVRHKRLCDVILNDHADEQNLYLFGQMPSGAGQIHVVDKKTWKVKEKINLPDVGYNIMAQDFTLID
ncbi:hypothetical protein [Salinithrix halophila]|uniref:Lipoprotein n=1 Tax=Salinithrix halophila TaxID=1485204 RepID=A0ABV8JKJ1_9BACL